ncbi:MAG: tyrosine-type recombinase/integrase [Saprospiraceae bacterium]|nr:tyrosine-type recombinase/integrase [Saprospiraceae bacterium]
MQETGIKDFLDYIGITKKYSQHTLKSYSRDLIDFKEYCSYYMELQEVVHANHFHIRSWLAHLSSQKLLHTSINRKISCLKSFYKWLIINGLIAYNPMKKIVSPKNQKRLPKFIQAEEIINLIKQKLNEEECNYAHELPIFVISLLYHTGMRSAELLNLKLKDLNFQRKSIKVLGKGSKERIIPMSEKLQSEIMRFMSIRAKLDNIDSDHLILTLKGTKPYPKLIYNLVQRTLQNSVRSDKKSPHVLRHSFATHLADNGAEIKAIQDLMGHSSLSATQIYTHNSIQKLKDEYQKCHPKAVQ